MTREYNHSIRTEEYLKALKRRAVPQVEEHDPLCLAADGEPCIEHGTPSCLCDCQCDLIAKVRADERSKQ